MKVIYTMYNEYDSFFIATCIVQYCILGMFLKLAQCFSLF